MKKALGFFGSNRLTENLHRLGRRSVLRISESWLGLIFLVAAWFGQLPVIHQLHLVFDHVEHVWCPVHHRLEHMQEFPRVHGKNSAGDLLLVSAETKNIHDVCPLSLMHQSLLPLVAPAADQTVATNAQGAVLGSFVYCREKVISYSPKLSPPCA